MAGKQVLEAVRALPPERDPVWHGVDEDDRPAMQEELRAGIAACRAKRGRPAGSGTKTQVAIRLDSELVDALRNSGPGWQTRVHEALKADLAAGRLQQRRAGRGLRSRDTPRRPPAMPVRSALR
ncbi:BrnA antitoxin family protein [Xylophilus sp.]|uniref:BrnA antitoxin family protein n=1 Tax=Xylophilus sp. TaxID=2653893 RepID=UPI002D7E407F|nr:BrnA antitoxin family protein [Xylophilus sp.]